MSLDKFGHFSKTSQLPSNTAFQNQVKGLIDNLNKSIQTVLIRLNNEQITSEILQNLKSTQQKMIEVLDNLQNQYNGIAIMLANVEVDVHRLGKQK